MLAISKGLSVFSEINLSDEDKEVKLRQQSLSVIYNSVYQIKKGGIQDLCN